MQLSDLFVSHKLVEPVSFDKPDLETAKPIYVNLDRAHKVTTEPVVESTPETETADMSTWRVPGSDTSDYNTRLRNFIIDSEGFRSEAYQDGKYYSIGYGFNGPQYKKGDTMTREEADAELDRQLQTRESKYKQRFGSKWSNLTDNQRIALMSYGYNTGDNNIINGDIAKYLDSGDMDKLRDFISINTASGKYNEGLEARRKRERELFGS